MKTSARLLELGAEAQRRRRALALTVDAASEQAGVSPTTWTNLEKGKPVRGLSAAAIERVLGYRDGAFDAFVNAGTPLTLRECRRATRREELLALIDVADWGDDDLKELVRKKARDAIDRLDDDAAAN